MRLDEMIIKAKEDGKTYYCNGTNLEYSKELGFLEYLDESPTKLAPSNYGVAVFINGWAEKQKRHLTVAEAEKELDCVIDVPDISKLFRPMSEKPDDARNVIIVSKFIGRNTKYCGFYDCGSWEWYGGNNTMVDVLSSSRWIDPADLKKLLPKE